MDEQSATHIKHGKTLGRMTVVLLVLFFVVYTAFQTFRFFFVSYSTESAYMFEVARVHTTNGLLIREEVAIPDSYDGAVRYIIPEGGKFIGSTPIALSYSSEQAADYAQDCNYLRRELEILTTAEQNARQNKRADIAVLGERVQTTLREFTGNTNLYQVGDTDTSRLALIESITGIQAAIDGNISFDNRKLALDTQLDKAEEGSAISVSGQGYFSRFSDGQEQNFTFDMIEDMTIHQLGQYLATDYPYNSQAFGRQITDYNWYYITTVPTRDAEPFQPGIKLNLAFVGSDETTSIDGWVESVRGDLATGMSMLVIKSDDMNADTVSRRTATVKLGFDDYRGIRFSKKALRINNGIKGVYVKGKDSIKFKKVDVVYTGTDFYLSRLDYNSQTHLNIFDEIIVEGSNLYDGKPLE